MPFNLDTWLSSRHDELARFTDEELRAEEIRQLIAEIENHSIPPSSELIRPSLEQNLRECRAALIPRLRAKLSHVSRDAAIISQDRSYQRQLIVMAMKARETGRMPDGENEMAVLKGYKAWLEKMEESDRAIMRKGFEPVQLREFWRTSDWRAKRMLVRIYGETTAWGWMTVARWKLTKVAVRCLLWAGRR